jgi:tetratricopeptide (TPR) repeat protein
MQDFDKALKIDSKDAKTWAMKGAALGMLDRYQEALPCINKAGAIDPQNGNTWAMKGAVLDKLEPRQKTLQHGDFLNRSRSEVFRLSGVGELFSGQDRCFDKALEIDPQNVSAQQAN